MIGFSLTEEQQFMHKLARDFAQKEMTLRAEHYDQTAEYPWEVIEKAHAVGLLNVIISEELGGAVQIIGGYGYCRIPRRAAHA